MLFPVSTMLYSGAVDKCVEVESGYGGKTPDTHRAVHGASRQGRPNLQGYAQVTVLVEA